jgi:hypothetical protein
MTRSPRIGIIIARPMLHLLRRWRDRERPPADSTRRRQPGRDRNPRWRDHRCHRHGVQGGERRECLIVVVEANGSPPRPGFADRHWRDARALPVAHKQRIGRLSLHICECPSMPAGRCGHAKWRFEGPWARSGALSMRSPASRGRVPLVRALICAGYPPQQGGLAPWVKIDMLRPPVAG